LWKCDHQHEQSMHWTVGILIPDRSLDFFYFIFLWVLCSSVKQLFPPSSSKIRNVWSLSSVFLYAFMVAKVYFIWFVCVSAILMRELFCGKCNFMNTEDRNSYLAKIEHSTKGNSGRSCRLVNQN
jgi:hypothetical protein